MLVQVHFYILLFFAHRTIQLLEQSESHASTSLSDFILLVLPLANNKLLLGGLSYFCSAGERTIVLASLELISLELKFYIFSLLYVILLLKFLIHAFNFLVFLLVCRFHFLVKLDQLFTPHKLLGVPMHAKEFDGTVGSPLNESMHL